MLADNVNQLPCQLGALRHIRSSLIAEEMATSGAIIFILSRLDNGAVLF